MALEDGLNAFKRGNYGEAIALLDAYCKSCEESDSTGSRNYMQAGMALVKSYHAERRFEEAIAQCQAFMDSDANPALKIWADKAFPKLQEAKDAPEPEPEAPAEASPTPQSQEKLHLLEEGINAQKFGENEAAIASLEEYLESCSNVRSRNYMQAQISRVKAYRALQQFDRAYEICEELQAIENPGLQSWATKAIVALEPHRTKPDEPEDAADAEGKSAAKAKKPIFVPRKAAIRPGVAQLIDNTSTVEISAVPGTPTPIPPGQSSAGSSYGANASTSSGKMGSNGHRRSSGGARNASRAQGTGAAALMGGGALLIISRLLFRRGGIAVIAFFIGITRACFSGGYVSDSDYYDDSYASDYTPGYVYDDLHRAACDGDSAAAESLIKNGANVNLADDEGNTPLFWAVSGCSSMDAVYPVTDGHQYIASVLIQNGASVNTPNIYGETPLHWSAAWGNATITNSLISQGASMTAVDAYESTPLHWAAWGGNQSSTEALVNIGAPLNAQNGDGDTPLDLANYYSESAAVASFLQSRGAIAINTAP